VLLDVIFAAKKQTKFLKKCEIHCSNSSKHVASVELQLVIGIFCANVQRMKKRNSVVIDKKLGKPTTGTCPLYNDTAKESQPRQSSPNNSVRLGEVFDAITARAKKQVTRCVQPRTKVGTKYIARYYRHLSTLS
jgi:hypothetical protein